MNDRAGKYEKVMLGDASYSAYRPNPLPPQPQLELDGEMLKLLGDARGKLGKLNAMSEFIPDIELFLGAYVRKEALLSSQIEGTQATLEDILSPDTESAVDLDVNDVVNYVKALRYAIDGMKSLPLCNRLLCETHAVLMQGVRGSDKNPGEFRRSQNWIGGEGCTINTARYVPPTVENMQAAMSALEKYINDDDGDALIKTALAHYQFETIHPFSDGNGRIGRMLICLMLLNEKILSRPVLYMSLFLKTNRIEYYDRLSAVRTKGDYEQWVKFFLTGIISTCDDAVDTISRLDKLVKTDFEKLTSAPNSAKTLFEYLKEHPIIDIGTAAKSLGLSYNTVGAAVKALIELDILRATSAKSRNRVFEYKRYIAILKTGT